jgi:large subunit ribosomal protein L28
MAKCEVCGKSVQFGANVSHSHKKVNKMWKPNIRRIRVIESNRKVRKYVCTQCIRSERIQKAV